MIALLRIRKCVLSIVRFYNYIRSNFKIHLNFTLKTVLINILYLFSLTLIRDYQAIPALDTYEDVGLDTSEYSDMSETQRREAEREIRDREREEGVRAGRMRRGLIYGNSLSYCIKFFLYESFFSLLTIAICDS